MRRFRRLHLYLGVAVTPMVVILGVSGISQVWHLHRRDKLGTYEPPWLLKLISTFHTGADLGSGVLNPTEAYRWLLCLVALVLVVSAALGLAMAWRVAGGRIVGLLLGAGVAIPTILLLIG
jgi:hypothetical protein